jgi:hypothetical protein
VTKDASKEALSESSEASNGGKDKHGAKAKAGKGGVSDAEKLRTEMRRRLTERKTAKDQAPEQLEVKNAGRFKITIGSDADTDGEVVTSTILQVPAQGDSSSDEDDKEDLQMTLPGEDEDDEKKVAEAIAKGAEGSQSGFHPASMLEAAAEACLLDRCKSDAAGGLGSSRDSSKDGSRRDASSRDEVQPEPKLREWWPGGENGLKHFRCASPHPPGKSK